MALGTIVDPWTLEEALSKGWIGPGDTVHLRGGIYTLSGGRTSLIGGEEGNVVTWKQYGDERPVFAHADGEPPGIKIPDYSKVSGIWFGGSRPASDEGSRTIVFGQNSIMEGCTLFNYINGLQLGSDAHGNALRRNRLVRCGYQNLSHPIYVANLNSSLPEHGVLSEENIMVASEGYSIHYYHQPSYGLAKYNFMGDCRYGMALQGDLVGPSGEYNIIWSVSQAPLFYSIVAGCCDNNLWHNLSGAPNPGTLSQDVTFDSNRFTNADHVAGTNPVTWQESDVQSNLGDSSANIDAAIAALDTAFQQTVQQIHDDDTIEAHFATLRAVIDTWKANTA